MSPTVSPLARRILGALTIFACAFGLVIASTAPAQALTRQEKREYLQALAAHEKLSVDVLSDMANAHGDGIFFLMVESEERDLQRIRGMLRAHGWKDLTQGDGWGEFSRLPMLEQMYFDMVYDGETSVADGARVGLALQQMSIEYIDQLLGGNLGSTDRKKLEATKTYAFNNWMAYREKIDALG